jgi:hypothetical protein
MVSCLRGRGRLVALAGFEFGLGTLPPIRGQGSADIIGFNERRARLLRRTYLLWVPVLISSVSVLRCIPLRISSCL